MEAARDRMLEHAKKVPGVDLPGLRLCILMRDSTREVLEGLERYFAHQGLSRSKFSTLALLFCEEERSSTPSRLAERVGITRASMTALLDHLEETGLVERGGPLQDRRMHSVRLSAAGVAFMEELLPRHYRQVTRLTGFLNDEEKRQLEVLVQKVRRGVDALIASTEAQAEAPRPVAARREA